MVEYLQILSSVVQILSSIVALISTIAASIKGHNVENEKNEEFEDVNKFQLGHKEIWPFLKWILIATFVAYVCATFALIYWDDVSNFTAVCTFVTYLVMLCVYCRIAFLGKKSLETRKVLAPKKLWGMLFNKIPEYIEECDGPFRIHILKIGVKETPSDNPQDDAINAQITKCIDEKIDEIKMGKKDQTFNSEDTPLYDIEVGNTLLYNNNEGEKVHGIIVFIGNSISELSVSHILKMLADRFYTASIGYLSYGAYPSTDRCPPYVNLKNLRPQDYIDHLIFRYYARSRKWRKLTDAYHKFSWMLLILVFVVIMVVPVFRYIKNVASEKSKIVVLAPHSSRETDFTKLVNCLLVEPRPLDVKLWMKEKDSPSMKVVNTRRYSEEGLVSRDCDSTYLISTVISNPVFLLYNPKQRVPFIVWSASGKLCEGKYDALENSYTVRLHEKKCVFKWKTDYTEETYDDVKIRVMYSYGDDKAIEVIYDQRESEKIQDAIRHSDYFLLPFQQLLICASISRLDFFSQKAETK